MSEEIIKLDEQNFIGKGRHKKTFLIPEEPDRCIKVAYSDEGSVDLLREIDYRALRYKQGKESTMLPVYYGKVKTDKGQGFIFERVVDFDGKITLTLQDYLNNEKLLVDNIDIVTSLLTVFKEKLFEERLLTMGIFPENILLQKIGPDQFYPRLINDMGCANFFRLEYYFDYFAAKKIARRWNRFYDYLEKKYKYPIMKQLLSKVGKI